MQQEQGRELNWNDTIVNDGENFDFILLEPGEYSFSIAKFERGRFRGAQNSLRVTRPYCRFQ